MYIEGASDIANNYSNSQPATYDYLKPNGFRFVIKDLPNVAYTCQEVTLPTVGVDFIQVPTPKINYRVIDSKPQFEDFSLKFIVSEGMQNYNELYNWILALPQHDDKIYREFINKRLSRIPGATSDNKYSENLKYSDASLFILNSSGNPKIEVSFKSLFPINVSPLSFDTTVDSIQYLVCGATFKYQTFEIKTL